MGFMVLSLWSLGLAPRSDQHTLGLEYIGYKVYRFRSHYRLNESTTIKIKVDAQCRT